MAFEGLSSKLQNVFKKLGGKGKLSEKEVREAMRINYFDDAALIQEQAERFAQK